MKKVIVIFIALFILVLIYLLIPSRENKYLMDMSEYKDIKLENIVSIERVFYGEGGDNHEVITETGEINKTYNMLKSIKLGKETKMSCDDNATVYIIYLNDGTDKHIEI